MVVVWLLRAVWIAGILPIVIACIPSSKLGAFHQLLLWFGGRGKIMDSSSKVRDTSFPPNNSFLLAVISTLVINLISNVYILVINLRFCYSTCVIVCEH